MAGTASLPDLLKVVAESFTSAASTFPSPPGSLAPPADGISLLDTKNDLLLSYLQNLSFLIILKLRNEAAAEDSNGRPSNLISETLRNLIELRTYLEKGVKPLERRLNYQIEKALRAAEDVDRTRIQRAKALKTHNGIKAIQKGSDGSHSDSDSGSIDSDNSAASQPDLVQPKINDLSHRPNPSALLRRKTESSTTAKSSTGRPGSPSSTGEAYRPPRINPTSMRDNTSSASGKNARSERRARKSHLLDEYANTELSSVPMAEPSIGSNATILARGRGALSARDREKEKELAEYEERNFARLPKPSKAEKKKAGGRADRGARDRFGGEDWTGLGEVGDRVARSVGRKSEKASVLERRGKRRRQEDDIPAGGGDAGLGIGENFEKKRKVLQQRAERKKSGK